MSVFVPSQFVFRTIQQYCIPSLRLFVMNADNDGCQELGDTIHNCSLEKIIDLAGHWNAGNVKVISHKVFHMLTLSSTLGYG